MNNYKIASNYLHALQAQRDAETQFNQALQALGSDNQTFGLAEPIEGAYNQLVQEILGPELWEWLMWWMYETDSGTKPMHFEVNHQSYDPTKLSFDKFWTIVSA